MDDVFSLRLSAEMKADLHALADQYGVSASDLIRAAVRQLVAREPIEAEYGRKIVGFRAPGVEVTGPPGVLSNVTLGKRRMVPIFQR
jgi:hypothetical protein